MQSLRSVPGLCYSLLLPMLINSSQAMEVVTHDGHALGVTAERAMHLDHGHDLPAQPASGAPNQVADDCLCDELCCVSSTQFAAASVIGNLPWQAQGNWIPGADPARPGRGCPAGDIQQPSRREHFRALARHPAAACP